METELACVPPVDPALPDRAGSSRLTVMRLPPDNEIRVEKKRIVFLPVSRALLTRAIADLRFDLVRSFRRLFAPYRSLKRENYRTRDESVIDGAILRRI